MQQDAHEFLNYLLNRVAELLQGTLYVSLCLNVPVNALT